jgi:hypothetical protein
VISPPKVWQRTSCIDEKLASYVNAKTGELASFSSYGCYPIFYIVDVPYDGLTIACPACASNVPDNFPEGARVVNADANWENPDMFCDCGKRIESAYAENEL